MTLTNLLETVHRHHALVVFYCSKLSTGNCERCSSKRAFARPFGKNAVFLYALASSLFLPNSRLHHQHLVAGSKFKDVFVPPLVIKGPRLKAVEPRKGDVVFLKQLTQKCVEVVSVNCTSSEFRSGNSLVIVRITDGLQEMYPPFRILAPLERSQALAKLAFYIANVRFG